MEAFSPATWYQRSDGDWVAVIAPVAEYDPRPLVGQPVAIGGSTYVVQGVETPELNDPTGWAFGLLVGDPVAP
jgi:hypothetical protein